MTDHEFLREFEECRLPKRLWTHEAHVRMAWLYLRREPLEAVIPVVRERIQRYNASLGNLSGYHETITLAYLTLVDHRLDRQRSDASASFDRFAASHPDLLDRSLATLLGHYSRERLFSVEAVATFIEPNLEPLPGRVPEAQGG